MRQYTALAAELAFRPSASAEEVREVAVNVHRYFTVALPLHEEDEEHSLFPRLLASAPEFAQTIAALREDHEAHARCVATLMAVCKEVQATPEPSNQLRTALGTAAQALAELWSIHLIAEEHDLFPAVKTRLSAEDRAAIREEMRERRARLPR